MPSSWPKLRRSSRVRMGGLCSVLMRVLWVHMNQVGFDKCFQYMTTLTHATSSPLCSLSPPWVRITHLNCKQATDLRLRQAMPGKLLHQTTSFPSTSSLLSLFAAWWTCILDIFCLCETCFVWWTCYVWTCRCSMNILWLMWYICAILCLWCQICVMYIVCDLFVNTEIK